MVKTSRSTSSGHGSRLPNSNSEPCEPESSRVKKSLGVVPAGKAVAEQAVPSRFKKPSRMKFMPYAALIVAACAVYTLNLIGASPKAASPPSVSVQVIREFPHDPESFCQGLVFHKGKLLEGTGQYQKSRLRSVEIETGVPTLDIRMDSDVFGEGVTVWKDRVLQLTWKNGYLLIYDANTLQRQAYVRYRDIDSTLREGWGLTHDGSNLIVSDGSSTLRFVDPTTFKLVRKINVKNGFRSLDKLNELEFVEGEIFANVWYRDQIARIDPIKGNVKGWLDLSAIKPREVRFDREAVLNGIAWDAKQRRLFVTGKNWPAVFEVTVPHLVTR